MDNFKLFLSASEKTSKSHFCSFSCPAMNMDRPVCGGDGVTVSIFRDIRIEVNIFFDFSMLISAGLTRHSATSSKQ